MKILQILGGLVIVVIFFFGTLFVLDYRDRNQSPEAVRDALRAEHARLLKGALAKFREAHGSYPQLPDNPVADLKTPLVDGGFLKDIPQEPRWRERPYRYTTAAHPDGKSYGLLFNLEQGNTPTCRTGVNVDPGWWASSRQQECPF